LAVDTEIKEAYIKGKLASLVVDSGATSTCVKPMREQRLVSECGQYELKGAPMTYTGERSNKIFQMAMGSLAGAEDKTKLVLNLNDEATEAHTVPGGLKNNLYSVNKLVQAGYGAVFDQDHFAVVDAEKVSRLISRHAILKGFYSPDEKLWRIPLGNVKGADHRKYGCGETIATHLSPQTILRDGPPPPDPETLASVYDLRAAPQIVRYFHAAAGFPTKPTWLRAIKNGHYDSWQGLSAATVERHYPESIETWKGHGRKIKMNLISTKELIKEERANRQLAMNVSEAEPGTEMEACYHIVYDLADEMERKMYSDQTGRFPARSYKGMQYVMVVFDTISNAILVEPMRDRTAGEMVAAYQKSIDRLKKAGMEPKMHILDNEISREFKEAIENNNMKYQLVPPNDHRHNVAEKAIQTFKDHFVGVLCGTGENFPMQLWCQILRPAEAQLNLLRKSRVDPTKSAYEVLYGKVHDYNANPWAPLGSPVQIHVNPKNRRTWDPHTKSGFYLGNSEEHYRCHLVWVRDTRSVRVGQTVFFQHKYLTDPPVTETDAIVRATDDLCELLRGKVPVKGELRTAVDLLMEIFSDKNREDPTSPTDEQRNMMSEAHANKITTENQITDLGSLRSPTTGVTVPSIVPDETDDLRTSKTTQIRHPPPQNGPNVIEDDDEPPNFRLTRASRRRQLLAMTEMSNACPTARQASTRRFPAQFITDFAQAVLDEDTGELLEYRQLIRNPKYENDWKYSFGNEIGRLAQGMPGGRAQGTNTLFFINRREIPRDRLKDIAHAKIVCNVRPQKEETNRTRLTFAGQNVESGMDNGTPTADLLTIKLHLNSVVSTPGARFMGLDIKNFYLNTPMDRPEYLKMKLDNFPDDVIEQYGLREKADDRGFVVTRVDKGMYGLPHAGIIAQNLLEKRLNKEGYRQSETTPGYWTHDWRPISFTLVVDDFGVKYVGEQHADHLLNILCQHYEVEKDERGSKYCGITLDWDYIGKKVHLSMPGYCAEGLVRFGHKMRKIMDQPHKHNPIKYGAKQQYAESKDTSAPVGAASKLFIQQVTGTFMFYARAVDNTMLVALSAIASRQGNPTQDTMERTLQFLDYVATHPDAILTFHASNMILNVHSDASYLIEPKARSRAGGHFFMSSGEEDPPNNGAVANVATIIKSVMSSAAEAEIGALFINSRQAIPARNLLNEMGHKQPSTPIMTDNTTALGFVSKNLQPKQTKSTDMRYWWMRDRSDQNQFHYYWGSGKKILADYFTKHFCAAHHREFRPNLLTDPSTVNKLRAQSGLPPHKF